MNFFYNENLYHLLHSFKNRIFGKNIVPEIQAKMLSANQIAEYVNQLFLPNKLIKLLRMVKNGYDQSGLWTLKLTVFEE